MRKHPTFFTERDYEVSTLENQSLGNNLGLLITSSVAKLSKNRIVPLLLIKSTNKTLAIKLGTPIARISSISVSEITSASRIDNTQISAITYTNEFDKVECSLEYKSQVISLLEKNHDRFAKTVAELRHNDTV